VAMSTNQQGYNPIRSFEAHGIFQPTNGATFNGFNKVIRKDFNVYAFDEGLPIDDNWVRFSWFMHIHYPLIFHS